MIYITTAMRDSKLSKSRVSFTAVDNLKFRYLIDQPDESNYSVKDVKINIDQRSHQMETVLSFVGKADAIFPSLQRLYIDFRFYMYWPTIMVQYLRLLCSLFPFSLLMKLLVRLSSELKSFKQPRTRVFVLLIV